MKLLAKRAEDRYQTAAGLESDLRRCQTEWEAQRRIDDFALAQHDTRDRLLIPEKLYGRRREVETLLASFDRVVNGGARSWSWSRAIPHRKVVRRQRAAAGAGATARPFCFRQVDQYKRDVPYSTLAQAFRSLVRPLLGKCETDLAPWRDALREALGPNAGLMWISFLK